MNINQRGFQNFGLTKQMVVGKVVLQDRDENEYLLSSQVKVNCFMFEGMVDNDAATTKLKYDLLPWSVSLIHRKLGSEILEGTVPAVGDRVILLFENDDISKPLYLPYRYIRPAYIDEETEEEVPSEYDNIYEVLEEIFDTETLDTINAALEQLDLDEDYFKDNYEKIADEGRQKTFFNKEQPITSFTSYKDETEVGSDSDPVTPFFPWLRIGRAEKPKDTNPDETETGFLSLLSPKYWYTYFKVSLITIIQGALGFSLVGEDSKIKITIPYDDTDPDKRYEVEISPLGVTARCFFGSGPLDSHFIGISHENLDPTGQFGGDEIHVAAAAGEGAAAFGGEKVLVASDDETVIEATNKIRISATDEVKIETAGEIQLDAASSVRILCGGDINLLTAGKAKYNGKEIETK